MPKHGIRVLDRRDFEFEPGFNVPGATSPIGRVTVPPDEVWLIDPSFGFELFLTERFTAAMNNDTATSQTLTLPQPIADNPKLTPRDGGIAIAYTDVGGTIARRAITAFDFAANTITVEKPANTAGTFIVYYLPAVGMFQLQVRPPVGATQAGFVLLSRRIRGLNLANPYSEEEAPRADKPAIVPGEWDIVLVANAPFRVNVTDDPSAAVNDVASVKIPYRVASRTQFGPDLETQALSVLLQR